MCIDNLQFRETATDVFDFSDLPEVVRFGVEAGFEKNRNLEAYTGFPEPIGARIIPGLSLWEMGAEAPESCFLDGFGKGFQFGLEMFFFLPRS